MLLDLSPSDLGISREDCAMITNRSGIGYQEVYSGPDMTLCIFLLRAGACIPLHDHPEMHVCSRLLFGRLRVVSFDFEGSLARFHSDKVVGPDPVTYSLGPHDGNLHELEALDDCAFFDVLTPPYGDGRDCNFYRRGPAQNGCCALTRVYPRYSTQTFEYNGPAFQGSEGKKSQLACASHASSSSI